MNLAIPVLLMVAGRTVTGVIGRFYRTARDAAHGAG
jgi:hypothetical protein